tara:strand:- start:92653 stop:93042 length:390 start_codon:yes stop_codon:yes gene_type:complete
MRIAQITAIVLTGIIGFMSVCNGLSVLSGMKKVDYMVLNWLVVYNVVLGIISTITAFLIWKYFNVAKKITVLILCLHTAILTYLYFFSESVATESIKAMVFRVVVWLLIYLLIKRIKTTNSNIIQTEKS